MPVRNLKARHNGFFPLAPMGIKSRGQGIRNTPIKGGVETQNAAKNVFENVFHNLKETSQKTGMSENFLRVSFKRWFGVSFTDYQKYARKTFIEKNRGKPNEWLCSQLGITKSTLSYLIKDLKAEGKLEQRNRVTEGRTDKLHLSYKPMAHEIVRLIAGEGKAQIVPEISRTLNRARNNVSETINALVKEGLLKRERKEGQRTYYIITPEGTGWLRKMEQIRRERDQRLVTDIRAIPGIIKRKEREISRFVFLMARQGPDVNKTVLNKEIAIRKSEIGKLLRKMNGLK